MGSDPVVSIVMGSKSDWETIAEAGKVLDQFNVPYEYLVTSAHRSPERTVAFARDAAARGIKVIIAGAGAAAHLAGVIASYTLLPVIGIPLDSSPLQGIDALLSTVQMPQGVPVATMAIGKAGGKKCRPFRSPYPRPRGSGATRATSHVRKRTGSSCGNKPETTYG